MIYIPPSRRDPETEQALAEAWMDLLSNRWFFWGSLVAMAAFDVWVVYVGFIR